MGTGPPAFWYRATPTVAARLLLPAAVLYAAAGWTRAALARPYRPRCPVICVGNFTAGGTGKTPLAILIARLLKARGERPAFLSRGYGGTTTGPRRVSAADSATDVGDEALLLAREAPAFLARDRAAGARAIEPTDASVIIMDDGLQNPGLRKDLAIAVVDGGVGLGNGLVMPAGPLRAPLRGELRRVDCVVTIDGPTPVSLAAATCPLLSASIAPRDGTATWEGVRVVAFAGIGRPEKFFRTLAGLGAEVLERHAFPDHHPFTRIDAEQLLEAARRLGARPVTTEKDWVRLPEAGAAGALKAAASVLPVEIRMSPSDAGRLEALLAVALKAGS